MILNATAARQNFFQLLSSVTETEEPVYITAKTGNVVVLSEKDYNAIMETLCLNSIPGERQKILNGMATPLEECVEDPDD